MFAAIRDAYSKCVGNKVENKLSHKTAKTWNGPDLPCYIYAAMGRRLFETYIMQHSLILQAADPLKSQ